MKKIGFALGLVFASLAQAQVQNQPLEIVTASPLSAVSERVGSWPVYELDQELMQHGNASIAESLNSVPGMAVRESGSPVVSIRGSAQADRVLRLLEGIPLNTADGVGANDIFFPIEILKSATIIKGPASVFYGPAAMAGALDHRLRIFERPAVGVTLSTENDFKSLGTRSLLAVAPFGKSGPPTEPLSQISIFREARPGNFSYDAISTDDSGERNNNDSDTTRGTLFTQFGLGKTKIRALSVLARNSGESPGSLLSPFISTFDNSAFLGSVEGVLPLSSTNQLSARITQANLWGLYDGGTSSQTTSFNTRSALSLDGRFLLGERVLSQTFVDLTHQELAASYLDDTRYYQDDADIGEILQISATPTLDLSPSLRYNSRTKETFGALSITKGFSQHKVYATYSQGYRTPSLTDLYADFSKFKGNPDLKAERSSSVELGGFLEQGDRYSGFFDGLLARLAAYHTDYSNLIDSRTEGAIQTKENVGEARVLGVETTIGYTISVWTFNIGYNLMDARNVTDDEPLRLSPKNQVTLSIAQQLGPVVIEAKETIWSAYYDRDPNSNELVELPGWETFDLTFRTLAITDWEFNGGIINVFDEPRELTIGYPEPQRRYFISALRSF